MVAQSLFRSTCDGCRRIIWCDQTPEKLCLSPDGPAERVHYLEEQNRIARIVGGYDPLPLAKVGTPPDLPKILHVFNSGTERFAKGWLGYVGIPARSLLGTRRPGGTVKSSKLESLALIDAPKVLVFSERDEWFNRFVTSYENLLPEQLASFGFKAIICPNFSDYDHAEHRYWIDARSVAQQLLNKWLQAGLPAILHVYLGRSKKDRHWLTEFLKANPTQRFIATGFDFDGEKDPRRVRDAIEGFAEVQDRVGRPLSVFLNTVVTKLEIVKSATRHFPRRVHIGGSAVVLGSVKGGVLRYREGSMGWTGEYGSFPRDERLFRRNATVLENELRRQVPDFF